MVFSVRFGTVAKVSTLREMQRVAQGLDTSVAHHSESKRVENKEKAKAPRLVGGAGLLWG
jgi:hypothetical protein